MRAIVKFKTKFKLKDLTKTLPDFFPRIETWLPAVGKFPLNSFINIKLRQLLYWTLNESQTSN